MKNYVTMIATAFLGGAMTLGGYKLFIDKHDAKQEALDLLSRPALVQTNHTTPQRTVAGETNFVEAANKTVNSVVHVKNTVKSQGGVTSIFDLFYGNGGGEQTQVGTGSGVIITPDGYIVTNNHVIANATTLEVTLNNNKTYTAKLIGTDASSDIALLKIEADEKLPFLTFADSDNTQVGEWVLAVGNPFNLNSTVTAGIISAKARNISELGSDKIESFIQTDAVVNMGNSGGALVNLNGDLIGINTAISSTTGVYMGYSFAVPSNIAKKVVEDIKKFGLVQRGFLGVGSLDLSNDLQVKTYNQRNKTSLKSGKGIYVTDVAKNSGAEDAGIKTGDIITKIDNVNIDGFSDLSLAIGSKRPGDKVSVTYIRGGKEHKTTAALKDQKGNTSLRSKADLSVAEKLGGEFESLSDRVKVSYGLNSGVIARNIVDGGELSKIGIVDNYIIMEINGKPVNSQKDIENLLKNYKGTVSVVYLDEYGRATRRGFTMP